MDEAERERIRRWAVSRPAQWYVDHPNADQAARRIVSRLVTAPLVAETDLMDRRPKLEGCPLTVRELQVVGGLAAGLSNKRIAHVLGIGVESVRSAGMSAYRKLGARGVNRGTCAVALAIRNGWL